VETLAVYARLVGAQLRSQLQYRVSFVLALVGSFLSVVAEFGGILVLFGRVPAIAGCTLPAVALLYGSAGTSYAVAEIVPAALDNFQVHILNGTFDRVLVRPRGALMQVMADDFALRRLGRVAQASLVLGIAVSTLPVEWTPARLGVLLLALASGIVIFFSIFVLGGAFCFWSVQGKEATHVFTYGGDGLASYPFDIYRDVVRRFFTFVMPLAFVAYQPALFVLERPDPLGLPVAAQLMSPLAALLMALLARQGWQAGVRHYQSTGS